MQDIVHHLSNLVWETGGGPILSEDEAISFRRGRRKPMVGISNAENWLVSQFRRSSLKGTEHISEACNIGRCIRTNSIRVALL